MNRLDTVRSSDSAIVEDSLELDAVLVYEDAGAGLRARQALECATRQLPVRTDLNFALWRFDLLSKPALGQMALDDAAAAGIVVLSTHGREVLPSTVRGWVERWLEMKSGDPGALVVSLDVGTQNGIHANQLIASLETMAAPKGVAVLPHFSETPGLPACPPAESVAAHSSQRFTVA